MYRKFLHYDIYERHNKIGKLIKNNESVLDVGGELDHLSKFCKPKKIVVANLTGGDIILKKGKLPFKNNTFSTVTSIDVLEHIPQSERNEFIKELVRVAKDKVVISFPVGTKKHIKYELKMQKKLKKKGKSIDYLDEHIKLGLPKKNEIEKITKRYKLKIQFSGNLSINNILFRIFIFDPKIKFVRKLIYYLKLVFNFFVNTLLYNILSNKKYGKNVIREYVIIKK